MFPISFTACYKAGTTVKKDGKIQCANIVELKQNKRDLDTLKRLSLLWSKQGSNFLPYLVSDFVTNFVDNFDDKQCLAVTLQENNFEQLDPQKILGVSLIIKEGDAKRISWLQVQPNNCYSSKSENKNIRQIGHSLLSYIIKEYGKTPIYVLSSYDAMTFYKKHGFSTLNQIHPNSLCYNA